MVNRTLNDVMQLCRTTSVSDSNQKTWIQINLTIICMPKNAVATNITVRNICASTDRFLDIP